MAGRFISESRWRAAACAFSLVIASPASAWAGEGFFGLTSLRERLNGTAEATQVGYYRPQACQPCPCYPAPGSAIASDSMPSSPSDSSSSIVADPLASGNSLSQPGAANLQAEQFAGLGSGTLTINDVPGGYIDNPIVGTWWRLRWDDAFNNTRPDRAEFFYAKGGYVGGPGPVGPGGTAVTNVDYRELTPYFELLLLPRLSAFVEIPVRFADIEFQGGSFESTSGLSDIVSGIKYALYTDPCQYLTFQLKVYSPSGDAREGLGTHHTSIEPGLLYLEKFSDRLYFQGELRHWVPIDGTDFAGNVLRYGIGFGYDLVQTYNTPAVLNPYIAPGGLRITWVSEFVGWTVMGGKETVIEGGVPTIQSASGDTIVNVKQGVRTSWGPRSFYVGYGRALTGDTWYTDLLRLEYRRMF